MLFVSAELTDQSSINDFNNTNSNSIDISSPNYDCIDISVPLPIKGIDDDDGYFTEPISDSNSNFNEEFGNK
jgi:hypothetical protein